VTTAASADAFQAAARFGLGPRPGEFDTIGGDPRGWVLGQIYSASIPPEVQARRGGNALMARVVTGIRASSASEVQNAARAMRDVYIEETSARLQAQLNSAQPFVERMVLFWSNHFTVSVQRPIIAGIVNQYEVEAIRANLSGHFHDMLLAVCRHPAMLFYLDNVQSFGPDSRGGQRRGKGLNENLAREILELHTLGVNGGYTQDDVIALAKIITGWTLDRSSLDTRVAYRFQPLLHEPGSKRLLGRTFEENGEQEGVDALTMLAQHPATAHHIAVKLARHFIADDPPPRAVSVLERRFRDSDGHLPTVMEALVRLDEVWQPPLAKFKNPYEFAVSALRLTGVEPDPRQAVQGLEALNFRAFNAPSPAGYDDTAAAWASPDGVMKRIEWAHRLALRMPSGTDPVELADAGIGPVMSDMTRQTVTRAASGADGIALLLASPEFLRR